MSHNVLYFPYIDVPESVWLTRTLLYWDTVGVIMPQEFSEQPEQLQPFTQELLSKGLLTQVFPGLYLGDDPDFSTRFGVHLDSLGNELDSRRRRFQEKPHGGSEARQPGKKIHLEKLGAIAIHSEKVQGLKEQLVDRGLAKTINSSWLSVEAETAEEFMYYLAIVLGEHKAVQLTPITDEEDKLRRFSFVTGYSPTQGNLQALRLHVLDDILPGPERPISLDQIEEFKLNFGDQLTAFRRKIEMELTTLADMQDPNLRNRRLDLFKESCHAEISELTARMQERRWPNIVFGRVCALLAPIPGVGLIPSLLNAAYTAFGSGGPKEINSPLGYAAYVRRRLFKTNVAAVRRPRRSQNPTTGGDRG